MLRKCSRFSLKIEGTMRPRVVECPPAPDTIERNHMDWIASVSGVDVRTVDKFLRGQTCKRASRARSRIIQAMRRLGWEQLIP